MNLRYGTAQVIALLIKVVGLTVLCVVALSLKTSYSLTVSSPDQSADRAIVTLVVGGDVVVDAQVVTLPWSLEHKTRTLFAGINLDVQPVTSRVGTFTCRINKSGSNQPSLRSTSTGPTVHCT